MDQPKIERMLRLMKMMSGNVNYIIEELADKLGMSYRSVRCHGFNGKFYTFPYFLAFLLKRFIEERNK